MEPKKQGGNNDHVVIVTSGAEGASVKKFRIKRWVVVTVVICVCVLIGAVIGYFINEERIWQTANAKIDVSIAIFFMFCSCFYYCLTTPNAMFARISPSPAFSTYCIMPVASTGLFLSVLP